MAPRLTTCPPNWYKTTSAYSKLIATWSQEIMSTSDPGVLEIKGASDRSTLRAIDLNEGQQNITRPLTGSSKALKALGITTDEYNSIMKDKTLTTEQKHLALLALIEARTKDGRKAQTDLAQ